MDGDIQGFELMRYANRAPLLFEQGACAITQAVQSVNWKRYGIQSLNEFQRISHTFLQESKPLPMFQRFLMKSVRPLWMLEGR